MLFQIWVDVNGRRLELDTMQEEDIDLTYSISDVADISKVSWSYSKTIDLPNSRRNRAVFQNIADLTAENQFKPNKKARCIVVVDTTTVFEGNLKLEKVSLDPKGYTVLKVVLLADVANLFSRMGEKTLTDLDLSDLSHVWNKTNVMATWSPTSHSLGYYYDLKDLGKGWSIGDINGTQLITGTPSYTKELRTTDFVLNLSVRTIWDAIFDSASSSYVCPPNDVLNSQMFNNLLISGNPTTVQNDIGFDQDKIFYAGITQSKMVVVPTGGVVGLSLDYRTASGTMSFPQETPTIINGGQYDFYDSNNVWTVDHYVNQAAEPFKQRFIANLNLKTTFQFDSQPILLVPFGTGGSFPASDPKISKYRLYAKFLRSRNPLNGATSSSWNFGYGIPMINPNDMSYEFTICDYEINNNQVWQATNIDNLVTGTYSQSALNGDVENGWDNIGDYYNLTISTDWLDDRSDIYNRFRPLFPGEEVKLNLYLEGHWSGNPKFGGGNWPAQGVRIVEGSQITTEVSLDVLAGQTINVSKFLPKNIKQKDFVTSIISMFNLFCDSDKTLSDTLNITTKDNFYNYNSVKDWTDKIDASQLIDQQLLQEDQKKSFVFSYKPDKDYYNTLYTDTFKEVWGQCKYEIDNDWLSDESKVDVVFSPTVVTKVRNSVSLYIPTIVKGQVNWSENPADKVDSNIRILQRTTQGYVPLTAPDQIQYEGTVLNYYPYTGYFDHPTNPTFDLNFGELAANYYSVANNQAPTTQNNLVNTYWLNTLNSIADYRARLVTIYMNLTPTDIHQFKFSDLIWIDYPKDNLRGLFKVQKIEGYNPARRTACKVELIKDNRGIGINDGGSVILAGSELEDGNNSGITGTTGGKTKVVEPPTNTGYTRPIEPTDSKIDIDGIITENVDGADTGIRSTTRPTKGVQVAVNGMIQKYGVDYYFSDDGVTVKPGPDISKGDKMYWNSQVAGFTLSTTDSIDITFY